MAVTEKQLISDLKAKKYAPVYLLTGDENYYIDQASDFMENNIVDATLRDFDQTVVYGGDVTMGEVLNMAKRFPMMSPVQLVLVKEAQEIGNRRPTEWEALADYLAAPQPQTVLVFCYRHKKLDKRSKAYKAIDKHGVVYEKNKLRDYEVPGWIAGVVQQKGFSITQRAAMLVADYLGNDLGKIANELGKVYISLPQGASINEETIERNIGISKDYNVFELQEAIGRRDVVKCTRIVNHFAANSKENPIQMMLPALYGYIIKVMLFHQQPDRNAAAAVMKVNPYFLKDYEVAASNYSLGKLASCVGYLYEADLKSKGVGSSGTISDGEIMKELVFKMIH